MKAGSVQRDEKSAKTTAELVRQFQTRFAKAMEISEAVIDDVLSYITILQRSRSLHAFQGFLSVDFLILRVVR